MKKYKIIYWLNGNKLVATTEAEDIVKVRLYYEILGLGDDIISIEEVDE